MRRIEISLARNSSMAYWDQSGKRHKTGAPAEVSVFATEPRRSCFRERAQCNKDHPAFCHCDYTYEQRKQKMNISY